MKTWVVSISLLSQFNSDDPATRNGDANNHTSFCWTCTISARNIKSTGTLREVLRILQTTILVLILESWLTKLDQKPLEWQSTGTVQTTYGGLKQNWQKQKWLYRQETIWRTINDCNNKRLWLWRWLPDSAYSGLLPDNHAPPTYGFISRSNRRLGECVRYVCWGGRVVAM